MAGGRLIAISQTNVYQKSDPTILMVFKHSKCSTLKKVTNPFEDKAN